MIASGRICLFVVVATAMACDGPTPVGPEAQRALDESRAHSTLPSDSAHSIIDGVLVLKVELKVLPAHHIARIDVTKLGMAAMSYGNNIRRGEVHIYMRAADSAGGS